MIEPAHGEQFFERGNVQHAIDILAVASSAYDDSPKQPTQVISTFFIIIVFFGVFFWWFFV